MRTKKGTVSSAKMTGTVSVTVNRLVFHPVYKKRYRKSKNFLCDPNGHDLYPGDKVVITECKPLSKNKYFKVTEIIKAAPRVDELKDDEAVENVIHREKHGADEDAKAKKESKKDADDAEDAKEKSSDSSDSSATSDSSDT